MVAERIHDNNIFAIMLSVKFLNSFFVNASHKCREAERERKREKEFVSYPCSSYGETLNGC